MHQLLTSYTIYTHQIHQLLNMHQFCPRELMNMPARPSSRSRRRSCPDHSLDEGFAGACVIRTLEVAVMCLTRSSTYMQCEVDASFARKEAILNTGLGGACYVWRGLLRRGLLRFEPAPDSQV